MLPLFPSALIWHLKYHLKAWIFQTSSLCWCISRAGNRPFRLVHFVFPFQTTWCPHGNFPFVFFISYAYICTCIRRHLKETIPSSNITWSEMGKQNIQAEKVYCNALFTFVHITNIILSWLLFVCLLLHATFFTSSHWNGVPHGDLFGAKRFKLCLFFRESVSVLLNTGD